MTQLQWIVEAAANGARPAIVATEGKFTYAELAGAARSVAVSLLYGARDLAEARVALMISPRS
jgi:hypothetical protein